MTQLKMTKQMLLAAGCVLVTALIVAPAALAQSPAADEYTLGKLPQAGDTAAGQGSGPASIAASSDAGGVPVLLIVLVAAAAVCTAAAIWRMRSS